MTTNMKFQKLLQMARTGEGKWMTLEDAKALKGKTIYWSHIGQQHQLVFKTTMGGVVSKWDYAESQECDGYKNRQEYWAKTFATRKDLVEDFKNTLLLLDTDGKPSGIVCYLNNPYFDVPTMTSTDLDRDVFYTEKYDECHCRYIKTGKGNIYNIAEPWNKVNDETGEVISKWIFHYNEQGILKFNPNPKYDESVCPTFNDLITKCEGIYMSDLDLAVIKDVRYPEQARDKALALGLDIPLEVFENNYKAWRDNKHSQKVYGDYVVYTPDGRDTLCFYISKNIYLTTQVDVVR